MAVFRPTTNANVCTLNFDDKLTYEIPLHENTLKSIQNIAIDMQKKILALKGNDEDLEKEVYNISLDAFDEILGEGAGADIMSIFHKPSLFDVAEVLSYIVKEYTLAFHAKLNKVKTEAVFAPESEAIIKPTENDEKRGRR